MYYVRHSRSCVCLVLLVVLLIAATYAKSDEEAMELPSEETWLQKLELPKFSLYETVSNVYLSRGRRSLDGWVREDSLYGEWYGFHAGVWSYSDLEGKTYRADGHRRHGEPLEWDYYFGYGYRFGGDWPVVKSVKLTLRYNYYDECGNPRSDSEDIRVLINTNSYIKTELQWRYTTKIDRNLFRFRLSKSFELSRNWSLYNMAEVWFGDAKMNGVACPGGWRRAREYKRQGNPLGDSFKNAIYSFVYTIGLDYKFNANCSFGPYAAAAWALDHDIREGWKARTHCNAFNSSAGCVLKLRF